MMRKIINPNPSEWEQICKRPELRAADLDGMVKEVFMDIKEKGDLALLDYTMRFDGVKLNSSVVSSNETEVAVEEVSDDLKSAIQLAKKNIERFHASQKVEKKVITTVPGVECWQESRPIQKVGIYIPGGTAPLFSTILMLAVPALLAGCEEVVLCSPPNKEGKLHPAILYSADLVGIEKIYKVGGIQAIAAMTYGTETIPSVYKIFGPGNQYVTAAKQEASRLGVAIDMPAGPSELLVMSDKTGNPAFIASDLLSQAEHGEDSQVVFVTTSEALLQQVNSELDQQIKQLPRRSIAEKSIKNSKMLLFQNNEDCLDFINNYAPEHLILTVEDVDYYTEGVVNAGSVFVGLFTPESAGDYASGTNHTLPTNGYAKAYSGVNLDSFSKKVTFQRIDEQGLKNIGTAIEIMADAEGLEAHKNAVTIRLNSIGK